MRFAPSASLSVLAVPICQSIVNFYFFTTACGLDFLKYILRDLSIFFTQSGVGHALGVHSSLLSIH